MSSDELQRAMDDLWRGSEARNWIKGRLGRIENDGSVTIKTGRAGFVHVRIGAEGEQGVAIARNLGVPHKPYLPVRMRIDESKGYYIIHGVDYGASLDTFTGGSSSSQNVAPHTHAIRSGLEYPVEALRLAPGRVLCDTGLIAEAKAFRYMYNGSWETYEGGTVDMTSQLPASTKWCWILVGIDMPSNTITAVKGADQDNQSDLTIALIDSVSAAGVIPLAAVQATSTDTSLSNIDRWQDARPWLTMIYGIPLDDLLDVVITSVADDEVLAYDNGTSKWINQTAAEAGLATSGHSHAATRPNIGSPQAITISSDSADISSYATVPFFDLRGEGAAADDCATIVSTNSSVGDIIYVTASVDTITMKDGTGNLDTAGDRTLDSIKDTMILRWDGTDWCEVVHVSP